MTASARQGGRSATGRTGVYGRAREKKKGTKSTGGGEKLAEGPPPLAGRATPPTLPKLGTGTEAKIPPDLKIGIGLELDRDRG